MTIATEKGVLTLIDEARADMKARADAARALHKQYAEKWTEDSKLLDAVRAEHHDGQAQAYDNAADHLRTLRNSIERKLR